MVKTQGYKPRQPEGPLPTGNKSKHECSPTKLKFINKTPWLKLRCSHRHTLFILLSLAKRYHSMFGYQNSGNVNILNSLTSYTNQEGQPKANSISIIKTCIICQAVFIYRRTNVIQTIDIFFARFRGYQFMSVYLTAFTSLRVFVSEQSSGAEHNTDHLQSLSILNSHSWITSWNKET